MIEKRLELAHLNRSLRYLTEACGSTSADSVRLLAALEGGGGGGRLRLSDFTEVESSAFVLLVSSEIEANLLGRFGLGDDFAGGLLVDVPVTLASCSHLFLRLETGLEYESGSF